MSASTSRRRVTYAQLEALWEILNAHRDLALGYNKSVQAREHSRRMWLQVADTLNSLGEGAYKDYKGWSSYWVDFKGKLKRRYATIRASRSRTGGGPPDVLELTDIEKKYLIIFGEDYGTGLPGIQVDPFPDSDTTNAPSENSPTILVAPQPSTSREDLFILENVQAEEISQQNESAVDDSIRCISYELPVTSTVTQEPTDVRPANIQQHYSGLSSNAERAVTPVYLRCREGSVSWLYPRGALRLLFRPPLPADERDFKVCIRVIRRPDPPDLFHTLRLNDTEAADRFPARLFVEGARKLIPLYAPNDGDPRELRCFRSRHGRAALYVEAEPEEGTKRRVATFKYEAKPLQNRHYDPATADCRPCSESELELAFCTSDLVSRGVIVGTEQREDLDTTQLTLRLTKLIRATGSASEAKDKPDLEDNDYYRYDVENTLERTSHRSHKRRKARSLHAHVHVSSVCGASAGVGEFLVMARRRLGRYSLVCAPRVEDWISIVEKRNADGTAHCTLQH